MLVRMQCGDQLQWRQCIGCAMRFSNSNYTKKEPTLIMTFLAILGGPIHVKM